MKILYVTTISNTINAFLIAHIKSLVDQGHEVDIACNIVREIDAKIVELGCEIHNVEFQRSPLKKDNYKAYMKIQKIIKKERYELIHTHTPIASFLVRLACKSFNIEVLYTAHGFHFMKGAPLKNWLLYYPMEMLAARWTDGIITINEEDYYLAKKLKLRKFDSVYKVNGVGIDMNKYRPASNTEKHELRRKYGYKDDDFLLIYAAELNNNKHQDLLISAINILKDRIPNLKLLLAGVGTLEGKYRNQVNNLRITQYVDFLGDCKDVQKLLRISDIGVSSSKREGLPVNVMEAMATGLPLVVTDCRGNRDLVHDGENGYVVGVDDLEGYAQVIEKLYKSKELRKEFGSKSLQLVKNYSLENVIKKMDEIYYHYLK